MQKESGIPIGPANIGFDHYAFELDDRDYVDRLHAFLKREAIVIIDLPADYPSYGEGYYAVFFLDPDGLKLEAVFFLEKQKRRMVCVVINRRLAAALPSCR